MTTKIAINGFGRIGRLVLRAMTQKTTDLEVVAVNDLTDSATLAHLLKYDSIQGTFPSSVERGDDSIVVDGKVVRVTAEADPAMLPWKELGVDIVLESTGRFRSRDTAGAHMDAGAKKVVVSAPGKDIDGTFVMGVNHEITTRVRITLSQMPPALLTAWLQWLRSSSTHSASSADS